MTFQELYSAAEALPRVVLLGGKFIIAWPFCYHAINGCRHLVRMCVGMCVCVRVCPRLILCKAQHLVHETQLLPSSMLSRLHITSQCVRYCVCVCACTYVTSLYVVCVAPPSSSPAVLGRRVWPGVHAVGVREWLHCLPPLTPRCTGRGLLQALTAVSHTTCLSNVCGIVIITDTTALTCYSALYTPHRVSFI